ncbi:hypothetical protein BKM30_24895 [Pseudomonas syringae pv. syringae]|nr:hypothetical protein BKM10_10460 [Pseudomonas syringae pv. syringae]POR66597.1 hypothetical protein BKM27_25120 [Pseudomonas syringae pv. syringae]POR74286.1 hypothetical protein BKM30_24895 [Pseudomonas syringae pv. syringae]PYD11039.1 hypothetical protein DND47_26265 [Pseudomonas syringae pv. syringae]
MLAPEKNREHSIKLQWPVWNVGFMRRLLSKPSLDSFLLPLEVTTFILLEHLSSDKTRQP